MEKDVDYYSIEKSDDAINFYEIEKMYNLTGNTNSFKKYSATDKHPVNGKVNYYRLKEYDKSGEYNYSPTRSVYFVDKDAELALIPNPAKDFVELKFESDYDKYWKIELYDKNGKRIKTNSHYANAGKNSFEMDLNTLESGIYFISVYDGETFYKRKLIKD